MQINITWSTLIVGLSLFILIRYLYFSFLKWYAGDPDAWDPRSSYYRDSLAPHEWSKGYRQAMRDINQAKELKKMRKKNSMLQNKFKTP